MPSLLQHVRTHPLGYRLLGAIVLASIALSLVSTALQLLVEYRWSVAAIQRRMAQVESSYGESLANSLWSFDEEQVRAQLRGIADMPDLQYVELRTTYGERYVVGTPPHGRTLQRTVRLQHPDARPMELGTFVITASLSGVYQHLRESVLVILLTQVAQTLVIALFTLFIFQYLVTRHQGAMASFARSLSLERLDRPLFLHRRTRRRLGPDELDEVSQAINEMRLSLRAEMSERRRAEAANRFLAETSRQLSVSLDYRAVAEGTCRLAVPELGDVAVCYVATLDGALQRTAMAAASPRQEARAEHLLQEHPEAVDLLVGEARAFSREHPLLVTDLLRFPSRPAAQEARQRQVLLAFGVRGLSVLPLRAHGRRLAVLVLLRLEGAPRYQVPADAQLLEEFGRRAATALDNARLYREAQEAIRLRDEFLTVASHELNTPLTTLRLQAQKLERLALSHPDEARLREALPQTVGKLDRQVERLKQLVGSLLDVSELQTGQLALTRTEVDLAALVREVLAQLSLPLQRAHCPVSLQETGRVVGVWDRRRLAQVVTGLLSNAMKFGAGSPIDVQVVARAGQALLTVTDRGLGIAEEQQSRIFERLTRAVSERHFGGLGLGLFIARRIVEAHGGNIHVESAPGAGATFMVELPLRPSLTPAVEGTEPRGAPAP